MFLSYNHYIVFFFFFFNDPAPPEISTLSLHDALPFCGPAVVLGDARRIRDVAEMKLAQVQIDPRDRKSTRLNSSHLVISYAVFCLKKKKSQHILFISAALQTWDTTDTFFTFSATSIVR